MRVEPDPETERHLPGNSVMGLFIFSREDMFICSRIKKRRKPRVKIVTLKLHMLSLKKPIKFI